MFVLVEDRLIHLDFIRSIDFSKIEELKLIIHLKDGTTQITNNGLQTIDILMALKPSALESKRLQWPRFAWAIHNLIGHPLMQVLAFFKQYDLAMRVHDITIPRPLGRKNHGSTVRRSSAQGR